MNCDFHRNRMADLVTDRLTGEEAARVREHLAHCPACRAYREELRELYAIGICDDVPPLTLERMEFKAVIARARRRRLAAWIWTAAALAGLLWIGWEACRSGEEPRQRPVALASVSLEMPSFPRHYPRMGMAAAHRSRASRREMGAEEPAFNDHLVDREEAARLSAYSGRAVLTTWYFPPCPRCRAMKRAFESPAAKGIFEDMITVIKNCDKQSPLTALEEYPTPNRKIFEMPAVVLTRGDKVSEPLFAIDNLEKVAAFVEKWRKRWDDGLEPLPQPFFERCVRIFTDLPRQLEAADFGTALRRLRQVEALGETFRTRFAADAGKLAGELERKLHRRLERMIAGGDWRRARLLVERLAGTALGEEFRALISRRSQ